MILLLLGIIGYLKPDLAGPMLNFDMVENVTHTLLGILALVLAPLPLGSLKKWVVVAMGIMALFFGIAGFLLADFPSPNFFGITNLEHPIQNVLNIVIGLWALLAVSMNKNSMSPA